MLGLPPSVYMSAEMGLTSGSRPPNVGPGSAEKGNKGEYGHVAPTRYWIKSSWRGRVFTRKSHAALKSGSVFASITAFQIERKPYGVTGGSWALLVQR